MAMRGNRRDFLRWAGAGSAALALGGVAEMRPAAAAADTVPKRRFGKTDVELSIIGFGGTSMRNVEQDRVNRLVAESVEQGVNFVDVSPRYGNAEELAGPAVEPYRDDIFLATKTALRDREGAKEEFERSLERLRTDHLDLYQLHNLQDVENDVEAAFASGGAMEVLLEAKEAGIVQYLGFSAHTEEAALRAMELYDFDSAMFPINFVSEYQGGFGPRMIEKAVEREIAIFALKPMVRQRGQGDSDIRQMFSRLWYEPLYEPELASLGLRWTLSKPGVTSALPPGDPDLYELAVQLAKEYTPLTEEEEEEVYAMAQDYNPLFQV